MSITENIKKIKESIPNNVRLVAVSKTKPNAAILEAYEGGHVDFGENKAQDLVDKYEALPKDIQWHFIGHLQKNKVKYLMPFVHLIHGVDSFKLLNEINKRAGKIERKINVLLQIHIAKEESKFGFDEMELMAHLKNNDFNFKFVNICGLMGMATNTSNETQIKEEFSTLKALFEKLKTNHFSNHKDFTILSMGMSGDYPLAIECGSNMIRVGSKIFGERNYN